MSETAVTPTTETPTLQPHPDTAVPATAPGAPTDGDAPRLGAGPMTAPAPMGLPDQRTDDSSIVDAAPTLPDSAPILPVSNAPVATPAPVASNASERFALNEMDIDVASLPTLPDVAAAPTPCVVEDSDTDDVDDDTAADVEPAHPMAHLMPKKSKPTEASIRAAEQRAIKKAKAKKIKIGVAVGALALSALAGPPAFSWLSGAINDAGDTSTDSGE